MSGLMVVALIWVLAGAGWWLARVVERRRGMARREFQRAMRSLGATALAPPDLQGSTLDGSYVVAQAPVATALVRTGVVLPTAAVLRGRRRAVTLATGGLAVACLAIALLVPGEVAAAASAVTAIVAVSYQITLQGIRRR